MAVSQLSSLGKVAGVPGVALGVVALVLGALVAANNMLPEDWRGPIQACIVAGVVVVGVLALLGWVRSNRRSAQTATTLGDGSAAFNNDQSKSGGDQNASSQGANAPAFNIRK